MTDPAASETEPAPASAIGSETAQYLDEKAIESFKRQTDLEESIWRSLPLFSGGLIAAGAIVSSVAGSLPQPHLSWFAVIAYACLGACVVLFGIAIWWLWQVIRPREFEYLPDDTEIAAYAENLSHYYKSLGVSPKRADKKVASELRAAMRDAYVNAAQSAFEHNQARISARSQVMLFMLWGFVLAFAADGLVIAQRLLSGAQDSKATVNGNQNAHAPQPAANGAARASDAAANADYPRWRMADQEQHRCAGAQQALNGRRRAETGISPAAGAGQTGTPAATRDDAARGQR